MAHAHASIGKTTLTQALPSVPDPGLLEGGIDQPGDTYERHADAVADAVVVGKSAEALLHPMPGGGPRGHAVQRTGAAPERAAGQAASDLKPPVGGIDKTGFIDNSDGAFIRTGPREAGGMPVRTEPLPPATRVFATGRHPSAPEWIYVTAFLAREMVRGYVQGPRINFDLPEPLAELRQLVGGETPEELAKEKFGHAVRDGHDLRFYENVLLYVTRAVMASSAPTRIRACSAVAQQHQAVQGPQDLVGQRRVRQVA